MKLSGKLPTKKVTAKRRAYTAPKILSAEKLEAAAANCAPPAGGFGKNVPIPCGTLGS